MTRRIYIIPKDIGVTEAVRQDAEYYACAEIALGIPPALEDVVDEGALPCPYEEPEPPAPEHVDVLGELSQLKEQLSTVEGRGEALAGEVGELKAGKKRNRLLRFFTG